jgi:cytochrome c biogenesis protein CcmG/thiol:disulfide interchange protein DsbE
VTVTATRPGPSAGRPPRRRRTVLWTAITVGVAFAVFAVILASQVHNEPSFTSGKLIGRAEPDVTLATQDGHAVRLTDYAGQTVVVNFWNEWCQPCKDEYPSLLAFYDAHAADGDVKMLGVLRDSNGPSAVKVFTDGHPVPWTIVDDPSAQASVAFGTSGQPETFVISPSGVVAAIQKGPSSYADLEKMLAAARRAG